MNTYNPDSMADRRALAVSLQKMFAEAGFTQAESSVPREGSPDIEEIYEREVPQVPGVRIVVFSSISRGAARPNGSDAIRVAIVYRRKDGEDKFLLSETRVNRQGSITKITDRTLERMREAFSSFRTAYKGGYYCDKCRAPLFRSRAGNDVCADTCWVTK